MSHSQRHDPRERGLARHRVVVLGASPKTARYSNQAVRLLKQHGYTVIPVHPRVEQVEGLPVSHRLADVPGPVDTLTLYVGPARVAPLISGIVGLRPERVILNPGTESPALEAALRSHRIPAVHGCTLVMLRTGQF